MIHKLFKYLVFTVLIVGFIACNESSDNVVESKRYQFSKILDIAYTPNSETSSDGWFADAGSWVGYTIPEDLNWVNGFCGPFSLDMTRRQWLAKSAVMAKFADNADDTFTSDSTNYFPGEIGRAHV